MRIAFLGAAGEVTGSCYLLESGGTRILVDCGLFQGGHDAYLRNMRALDFDVGCLAFVLLTHAHLDHSGLLPRLVALGYRRPIYATGATADLCEVLLADSAHIQEKDAEWARRHGRDRRPHHGPARVPLYSVAQAQDCLRHFRRLDYDREYAPAPGIRLRLCDAGHILGSAIAEVWVEEGGATRKIVFSGDLGQPARPVVRDPTPIPDTDFLLVESTYGNRLHKPMADTERELVGAITNTLQRSRGNVVIPAFAVGRTQELLYVLADLCRAGKLPAFDVVVDSPMATAATALTLRHEALLDAPTRELLAWQRAHPDRPRVRFVQDVEESMALNAASGLVIVSASGMCEAGRIRHHLRHNLPRPESAIVIVGFQAAGTLGRRLVDGAREVTLFGEHLPVRASVHTIGGLSAHADQQALLGWLRGFRAPPKQTFIVHGEVDTAQTFCESVRRELGWSAVRQPARGDVIELH